MAKVERSERLDQYLVSQQPELSRASLQKLIENGHVQVNGAVQPKAGYKLKAGDVVKVQADQVLQTAVPVIELPIIYEDEDCVVINKPTGVLSHSKGAFNPEATVASWLQPKTKGLSGERSGIVHRLDRATSGVMIGAKTALALSWLQKQFSQRKAKKVYIAVVQGVMKQPQAVIDMPIERNPKRPQTFRTGSNGKPAITAYQVLRSDGRLSLLRLEPQTGRTHQLRVHLAKLGHPIVGDTLYGGLAADRLYLHARSLELTLPNKRRQCFEAPLPPDFEGLLS